MTFTVTRPLMTFSGRPHCPKCNYYGEHSWGYRAENQNADGSYVPEHLSMVCGQCGHYFQMRCSGPSHIVQEAPYIQTPPAKPYVPKPVKWPTFEESMASHHDDPEEGVECPF